MDFPTKLMRPRAEVRSRARQGAALATALFALTAAAMLTAGVHWMTRVDIRTTANRESAARALTIAEAGVSHALAIMRDTLGELSYTQFLQGPDAAGITDDGLLIGRTLSSGEHGNDIPATGRAYGGGSYTVKIIDDPLDTDGNPTADMNSRVIVQCTGHGPDGARADLEVLVGGITMPGFIVNGDATIGGDPIVADGRCGGVHVNGNLTVSGELQVTGPVSTTGTATGVIKQFGTGTPVTPQTGYPAAEMPEVPVQALCDRARYLFRSNGTVRDRQLGLELGTGTVLGFKLSGTEWSWQGVTGNVDGTFCFEGNVIIGGDPIRRWSIYATGSVKISGSPQIKSFDDDSILVAALGDLNISGNPVAGSAVAYAGAFYAKNQCQVSGNPDINGQFICENKPQTSGAMEYATENSFSGKITMTYNCNNKWASTRRYIGWMQRQGNP
jgi:hypothetical protein